jgi:hypothetical protein
LPVAEDGDIKFVEITPLIEQTIAGRELQVPSNQTDRL